MHSRSVSSIWVSLCKCSSHDALALELGLTQKAISQLEQKEALDAEMLEKIAAAFKVPAGAIKNFRVCCYKCYLKYFS